MNFWAGFSFQVSCLVMEMRTWPFVSYLWLACLFRFYLSHLRSVIYVGICRLSGMCKLDFAIVHSKFGAEMKTVEKY